MKKKISDLNIALIHDFAFKMGGAERCVEGFCEIFPQADIFMLFGDNSKLSKTIQKHSVKYSFLNRIPGIKKFYRYTFPLWPIAIESFDLSGYDLVVSQSTVVAKGILTGVDTLHICYMNAPMRYCWDLRHQYFNKENFSFIGKFFIPFFLLYLRIWDIVAQNRVDRLIVNSDFQKKRVEKYYKVSPDAVIYPPVELPEDLKAFVDNESADGEAMQMNSRMNKEGEEDMIDRKTVSTEERIRKEAIKTRQNFYLSVAPFAPNKNGRLVLETAKKYGFALKIIGTGQLYLKFIKKYKADNIEFLGWVSEEQKWRLMTEAKGLIMAGVEDFGIAPLEAMYCGTPVIAYAGGGALETVKEGETGVFFSNCCAKALYRALKRVDAISWDENIMQNWVKSFDKRVFKNKIEDFVENRYNKLDELDYVISSEC